MNPLRTEAYYYKLVTKMAQHRLAEQVLRLGDILNTKAAALLTHVSIMIGVSTAILALTLKPKGPPFPPSYRVVVSALSVEIILYLITTLLALYAVRITGPKTFAILGRTRRTFVHILSQLINLSIL